MNFQLSEEQQMLADSAKRFVRDNSDVEKHRQNKKLMPLDAATWQQFADLGWLAVRSRKSMAAWAWASWKPWYCWKPWARA